MGPGRSDAGSGVTTPLSHSQSSSNSYTMAYDKWAPMLVIPPPQAPPSSMNGTTTQNLVLAPIALHSIAAVDFYPSNWLKLTYLTVCHDPASALPPWQ